MSDSAKIARRLMEHLREADTIALYLADENEVDLRPLLPLLWETKRIAVPVCAAKGAMCMSELTEDAPLVKNRYGIEEPATLKLLPASVFDVIVVPIVAFDANGHRLGHAWGIMTAIWCIPPPARSGSPLTVSRSHRSMHGRMMSPWTSSSRHQQSMISAALQERVKRSRGFFV